MTEKTVIRYALETDLNDWLKLWAGYNVFYESEVPSDITALTWQRILDPNSTMFCRIAEQKDKVVGFSTGILHDSTWTASPGCYLEDLFVDPSCRGQGIGRLLIDDLVSLARQNNWTRLYWHTREDNPARKLYDEFAMADGFVRYRLQF
ncbi:GNAT family N-acetyltransferase [Brenneria populi]|uniref:GNAT family N-acetyltransferase n=1 Tax=Brenneria populi TaxID=1505588 RepID=A0ABU6JU37_9GAMM|nr:GNAT family N-acetyltransferase [Brenneria populi Li et al. 2015]